MRASCVSSELLHGIRALVVDGSQSNCDGRRLGIIAEGGGGGESGGERSSSLLLVSGPSVPLLICRHISAVQSLWLGSLTAQCGSSINQRHFQCPITETVVLGLSEADSSPIHLPARQKKKPLWHAARFYLLKRAQEDPSEIVFSRSGKQQKR